MRRKVIAVMTAAMMLTPTLAHAGVPAERTCSGRYYDYMTIVTTDGNEWLLSDEQKKSNPYMVRRTVTYKGRRKKVYVPRFRQGQRVKVRFATMGTKTVKDDRIMAVKAIR